MEGKKLRKIKLGILTMGILILGVILSLKYGGAADKTEMEFSDRRETEEAPGALESGTEEPEPGAAAFYRQYPCPFKDGRLRRIAA